MHSNQVDVMFIGGASRTGSTLLSLLLGSLPGHFAVGELRYLWLRGLQEDQLCGCGEPLRSCPLWKEVITTGLGAIDAVDVDRCAALWQRTARPIPVLRDMALRTPNSLKRRHEYLDLLRRVLLGLDRVTQGQVIVDSSKYATDCLLLSELPGVRVHAIHLVRDSRAVAYSWRRKKQRPEIHWRQQNMSVFSPWRSSFDWASMNAAMEAVARRVDRYERIRYEDLVCDPVGTLGSVLPGDSLRSLRAVLADGQVAVETAHTVSGNPLRFSRGPMTIRPDVEWRSRIDPSDRRLVTALTTPWLLHYGYPLSKPETPDVLR